MSYAVLQRVAAGDPGNSHLVQKLEGTASSGQQRPLCAPNTSYLVLKIEGTAAQRRSTRSGNGLWTVPPRQTGVNRRDAN